MPSEITLILNADDLGYDPAVTRGILRAMREGVVTSTTLLVNTPHSEEAARGAEGLAVGLHFNLARFPPVWERFPRELLKNGELSESRAADLPVEVVEAEATAQLERCQRLLGRRPTHMDVHKHLHLNPSVLEGLARAAKRYGVPVRSIDAAMRAVLRRADLLTNDHFIGDAGTAAYWTLERFAHKVALLQPGVTDLMCHPGYAPSHVKSGYAAQREVELATLTDPRARELLDRSGARLADYSALAP
ncbi:MAG TPA: ChbG/HpnK family deacetylase [Myxococcaceae bacterium]|nr:ChbG/HpnK family deacetylase [Myxococcaceae bacterium]